jgi:hypothetical protein
MISIEAISFSDDHNRNQKITFSMQAKIIKLKAISHKVCKDKSLGPKVKVIHTKHR